MALEDSRRKLKKKRNEKKNIQTNSKLESSLSLQTDNFYQDNKAKAKKNRKKFAVDKDDNKTVEQLNIKDESDAPGGGKKKSMKLRSGKKKNDKIARLEANEVGTPCDNESRDEPFDALKEARERQMQKSIKKKRKSVKTQVDKLDNDEDKDEFAEQNVASNEAEEHKTRRKMKKKRKSQKAHDVSEVDKHNNDEEDGGELKSDEEMVGEASTEREDHMASFSGLDEAEGSRIASSRNLLGNSKKARKVKKKSQLSMNQSSQENSLEKKGEAAQDEVYEMSSGDEDSSKGMKKWVMEYYQSRPGLKVLQERIDDFIAAHEAQEEQAREEREAKAAEGGWTVVVHHKGRKKTADAESGTVVGSVAQAAVLDKMTNKKNKDPGPDFYRFQKREAHRNEIMMLQSKFEQDKKRIQQMRAERKFRPY